MPVVKKAGGESTYPNQRMEALVGVWRLTLAAAERRHVESRTRESRAEFLRVLGLFTELVMRGVPPAAGDPAGQNDE